MSVDGYKRTIIITNPQGLHMRPLAAFVEAANRFQSEVYLGKDNQRVNGKSMIHLLGLAAEQGAEVTVEASGPDAAEALEALLQVLSQPYDEP